MSFKISPFIWRIVRKDSSKHKGALVYFGGGYKCGKLSFVISELVRPGLAIQVGGSTGLLVCKLISEVEQ